MISSRTGDFYEVGIRYDKTQEDGQTKKVTEKYCFDALSFGEAEEKAIKEMQAYISGDYKLTSNSLANYHEIILTDNVNADRYFKVRVAFITIDEKTEKEKRRSVNYLVKGIGLHDALKNVDELFGRTMIDYVVTSVAETKIMDVFLHEQDKPKEQDNEHREEASVD